MLWKNQQDYFHTTSNLDRCFLTYSNSTPEEIKRTRMLFGHGWMDKTRPHNLFADWSQGEKKQHVYREIEGKKDIGTDIRLSKLMSWNYVTFVYSGRPSQTSARVCRCLPAPLYCMHSVFYWTKVLLRADWFSTPASKLWGSHTCKLIHDTFIHSLTHSHMHWVSPLCHSRKKKTKQKLRHTPALLLLSQNEGIN